MTTTPKAHPLLAEKVDTDNLDDGDIEVHYVDSEVRVVLRGVDVTDMVQRVSYYWMKGMAPRVSLDFGLSTLDILCKVSTASFRRPPE